MTSSGPSLYIEPRPQAGPGQIIHASLPFYILVERRPTPDNPDLIEAGCGVQNGAGGRVVYRSPVHARLLLKEP